MAIIDAATLSTMTEGLARTANAFLEKGKIQGKSLSPMKLIKLCYIAQGVSLLNFGEPLFTDEIQAWKYGPVIPDLYVDIKEFGNNPINRYCCPLFSSPENCAPEKMSVAQREVIDSVWQKLSNWSAIELSTWTHQKNSAWDKITQGGKKILNSVINLEDIKHEFELLKVKN